VQETAPILAAGDQPRANAGLPTPRRRAVYGVLAGALLFTAAALYPRVTGIDVHAGWTGWPPLAAAWRPRLGPGTLPALAVAAAVIVAGQRVASRLSWRALVVVTWTTAWMWTVSLALVDGRTGIAQVFARPGEYVSDAVAVSSIPQMLSEFVSRIPSDNPDHWGIHASGHPAGAMLFFVVLARLGVTDPFAVGMVAITIGTTAAVAALIAVRPLAGEDWARRAALFWAAAPAAVWVGVSADAIYTAFASWGLALLALAATRAQRRIPYAIGAGLLLGYSVYLSYGLGLLAILAVAVLLAARTAAPLPWAVGGALCVVGAFTAAGFAWWEAYPVLVARYYDGVANIRPFSYWVWGNLAAVTAAGGLAVWAGLPGAGAALRRRAAPGAHAVALLGSAAVLSMVVATATGMSKAEVERIWLPFTWWALCLPALLAAQQRRWLVGGQVVTGLLIAHLLAPGW
jgi:hypothetical protein